MPVYLSIVHDVEKLSKDDVLKLMSCSTICSASWSHAIEERNALQLKFAEIATSNKPDENI